MGAKTGKMTEQEAAAKVVAYLEESGLDVYQEVALGDRAQIADIVALRGKEVWIVEVKTSWSLDLLDQCYAHERMGRATRVFAAVPDSPAWEDRAWLFRRAGFGAIRIQKDDPEDGWNHTKIEVMAPRMTPRDRASVLRTMKLLEDGHKTHAQAGAPGAKGRWSPFRGTCEALLEAVQKAPGIGLSAAVKGIRHHYNTDSCARSSLATWVKEGKVPGLFYVRQGRALALYPDGYPVPAAKHGVRQDPLPEWAPQKLEAERLDQVASAPNS